MRRHDQSHNLGVDAALCQLRDVPAPAGMAGGSIETGLLVQVAHHLAQDFRRKGGTLLRLADFPCRKPNGVSSIASMERPTVDPQNLDLL